MPEEKKERVKRTGIRTAEEIKAHASDLYTRRDGAIIADYPIRRGHSEKIRSGENHLASMAVFTLYPCGCITRKTLIFIGDKEGNPTECRTDYLLGDKQGYPTCGEHRGMRSSTKRRPEKTLSTQKNGLTRTSGL